MLGNRITNLLWLAGIAATASIPNANSHIARRATASDACPVGYCTMNGGTKGGAGGKTITVQSLSDLTSAAAASGPAIIMISGQIDGSATVQVSSDKTIIGKSGSSLNGVGFTLDGVSNVILRNLKISKVTASNGDAIGIRKSSNVWVDSCDLSSDQDHDKDYYDGLLDITHAAEWITVSNTFFHDHWKSCLIGHSDDNGAEDTGHLHITYVGNYFKDVYSRTPSVRFGTGHIFNSYHQNLGYSGIDARMGAQLLIESVVFEGCPQYAIFAADDSKLPGFAVTRDVSLGGSKDSVAPGKLTSVPYQYSLLGSGNTKGAVMASAGQKLSF